jgi:hypothetical protein
MGSPTSVTTENPEPRRKGGASSSCSKGTPAANTEDIDEAYYSEERPFRGPWPSEVPATGVLGEMAFYYGACWLHHHSMQRRGRTR